MRNSNEDLLQCLKEGILVTPWDTEASFFKRAERYRQLPKIAFKKPLSPIASGHAFFKEKKRIFPWFAGLTRFIFEEEIVIPQIEVSAHAPAEVLDHELVHALRAPFEDSIFEEFFAFESSTGVRRFLGPLFFHAYEPNLLMIGVVLSIFFPSIWTVIALAFTYLFWRLKKTSFIYQKGLQQIQKLFSTINPLPYALFFSQEEFCAIATGKGAILLKQMQENQPLRYAQIFLLRSRK